jgi:thioesterase domain-containing protein
MLQPGEASTIEEIAAAALTVICRYQQEGPYWLGGWSASGVVAFEVAQQLVGRGQRVDFLALFDVKNPEVSQPIERKRGEAYRQKMRFWVEELRGIELSQLPDYFSEKARELKRKIRQGALRTGFGPEPDPTQAAVSGYRPLPYEGGVTFFRAGSRPQGEAWDFSLGWQHLVSGGFEIHEVPGNHQSMFSEPNVKVLAKKMSLYLAANLLKRSTNNLAVATLGMVSYALNYA